LDVNITLNNYHIQGREKRGKIGYRYFDLWQWAENRTIFGLVSAGQSCYSGQHKKQKKKERERYQ
jgi:hypothetical protein